MAYVAVAGGQEAILESYSFLDYFRLQGSSESIRTELIEKQLRLLIDRVMGEGGLYAPEYAAIALKQAEGDPMEAAFLLRAYRSTLPRNHYSFVVEPAEMRLIRRISSSFRDIPGGQLLGPTYDYTHRLLKFSLRDERAEDVEAFMNRYLNRQSGVDDAPLTYAKITDLLREQGMLEPKSDAPDEEPFDITRKKLVAPAPRSAKLQALARGETGAMNALAYSILRGYGAVHPTIGELRVGYADVMVPYPFDEEQNPNNGFYIGDMLLTEVETTNEFAMNDKTGQVQLVLGYGLCVGHNENKAISMAILERSLDSTGTAPTQDEEFVLFHIDSIESSGMISHLKLPHYVTFQSILDRFRQVRQDNQLKNETERDDDHEYDE